MWRYQYDEYYNEVFDDINFFIDFTDEETEEAYARLLKKRDL